jgi:hypothetical protein
MFGLQAAKIIAGWNPIEDDQLLEHLGSTEKRMG